MAELIPYANNDVCLTTQKGHYRIPLEDVVAIEVPTCMGVLYPDHYFLVKYNGNQQLLVRDADEVAITEAFDLLLAHWESFNRHNRVYENSNSAAKTTKLSNSRAMVQWGGNTVVIYLAEIEGMKETGKGLVVNYHGKSPITFMSEKPSLISTLRSGIESYLNEVKFV